MAGSISLSLSQQFDSLGAPLNGGLLYFIQAGTTATPQNAYQDAALTIAWPNPMTLDSAGRVPQLFFADGTIKIRLTNSAGVVQVSADNVMVVGASSGSGGGGGSVDATTVLQAGQLVCWYGTGTQTGFVRANGRTIGNSSSGATELASTTDASALYTFLWNADPNLSVSTGRGASAAADFAAAKTIALPDYRGRVIAGLDDMGTSAAGRLTATYFGTAATALGAASTTPESKTLLTANLPAYTPAGSVSVSSTNSDVVRWGGNTTSNGASAGVVPVAGNMTPQTITSTGTLTGTAQGGTSTPFSIVQPTMLATIYVKL